MTYLNPPKSGTKVTINNGKLQIPNDPIIPFIEGDGIGPDIWAASVRVFDEAVKKAYKGDRKINWFEVYAGEKAKEVYGDDCPANYLPDESVETIRDYLVAIKGPLTTPVGGGIRKSEDVRAMLNAGADKVAVNSAAILNPMLIHELSERFGSQCIVIAIDAKQVIENPPKWEIYTHGGRKPTGIDAIEWAVKMTEGGCGAGEVLLTSMDRDGTKDGFDIALTRAISDAVDVPVIASGGVGNLSHLSEGILEGGADAVLAASIFHFGEYTVSQAKLSMQANGIEVRL